MDKLNVVYIHSHDTGRYVQPYGYPVRTPHIQRLAEQGVLFRQNFCINPTCSASRSALLTGMCPHSNGMVGLAHRGSRLKDYRQHLVHTMNRGGYHTALSGGHHEIDNTERELLGYNEFLEPVAASDPNEGFALAAADFIQAKHEKPFFLSCGFGLTHRTGKGCQWHNGAASPVGDPRYTRPPAPLPDTPVMREDFADFCVAAERLDRRMGIVFEALDRAKLADCTLVICTTDHGIAFPHMKCNLYDHGTGVMLILRGPGFTGGRVIDPMVTHMDVFPTICEVTGMPAPDWLQGKSLVPLVDGDVESLHETVFAEVNWHAAVEPLRSARTTRHKYIRRYDVREGPVLSNCDQSPSKNEWLKYGWADRPLEEEQLFDLIFDPHEACNRAGDPAYAEVLADMRQRLGGWMKETDDPLLTGEMTPWPKMMTNPIDDPSPQNPMVAATPFRVEC